MIKINVSRKLIDLKKSKKTNLCRIWTLIITSVWSRTEVILYNLSTIPSLLMWRPTTFTLKYLTYAYFVYFVAYKKMLTFFLLLLWKSQCVYKSSLRTVVFFVFHHTQWIQAEYFLLFLSAVLLRTESEIFDGKKSNFNNNSFLADFLNRIFCQF